jgi:hypothetical protein
MGVTVYCMQASPLDWGVFARAWAEKGSATLVLANGKITTHRGWVRITWCNSDGAVLTLAAPECTIDQKKQALTFETEENNRSGHPSMSLYAIVTGGDDV